jgi:photosynthetic reaction center cytochrome c subunit
MRIEPANEKGKAKMMKTVATIALCLVALAAKAEAPQGQRPQMAEDVFKNVQVLKGIPVDEFMDTMGMISASTGMNCVNCHASDNTTTWDKFADDTPLKETARKMLLMVNTINKDNFKGVRSVTCYTCHNGIQRPKVVPSLLVQYGTPLEDPNEVIVLPGTSGPPADEIFEKYFQAMGGKQNVANLTSLSARGTYSGYDTDQVKVPVEIFAKAPNQRAVIIHAPFGDSVRTYDGQAAWVASADKPLSLMSLTGGNLEGAKVEALSAFPIQLQRAFNQWRVSVTEIDGKEVQVAQGTNPRQPPVNLYFDKSGLLVRLVRFVDTAIGRIPTQIDFSDYREVGGIKMPFRSLVTWTDGQSTIELSEIQPNTPVDAAKFAKPAPAPPPKSQ